MSEIWKLIPIEGNTIYHASDAGRIMNTKTNKIITPYANHGSYLRFAMTVDKFSILDPKRKLKTNIAVHRAVALAFHPNPDNLPQVNHKDKDRTNNAADNLEWTTQKENSIHAANYGDGRNDRLTKEQVFFVLENPHWSYIQFVRNHNISYGSIVGIRKNRIYKDHIKEFKKISRKKI